jgi:hypothetical protein
MYLTIYFRIYEEKGKLKEYESKGAGRLSQR